jgi:hypothetical protein
VLCQCVVVLKFKLLFKSEFSSATSSDMKFAVFLARDVPPVQWHDAIRHVERTVVQPASVCVFHAGRIGLVR